MNNSMIQKLQWQIVRFAAQTSAATKLAIAILLAVLLLYGLLYRPQAATLQQLMANQSAASINSEQAPPKSALNTYLQAFPKVDARAAKINALMDIANQQHVLLDEVRYNVDTSGGEPSAGELSKPIFSPYHVEFNVFATYPEIHQFLSEVLKEMPYVAVERLDLSREDVQDEVIEAHIKLVFYFGQSV
jgi:hypothetical protein